MSKDTSNRVRPLTGGKETAKTLVRNCRSAVALPVSESEQNPSSASSDGVKSASSTAAGKSHRSVNTIDEVNLGNPRLHSSLKMKENIDKMKAGMKSVRFERNAPPEQRSQASKKVNIRFDEIIYRDLIDLKVTEEDLGLHPISSSKPKDTTKPRDPVPILADFYIPKFDKEYVVKPYPPLWPQTFHSLKKLDQRKRASVLDAVKRWNVDDNSLY